MTICQAQWRRPRERWHWSEGKCMEGGCAMNDSSEDDGESGSDFSSEADTITASLERQVGEDAGKSPQHQNRPSGCGLEADRRHSPASKTLV